MKSYLKPHETRLAPSALRTLAIAGTTLLYGCASSGGGHAVVPAPLIPLVPLVWLNLAATSIAEREATVGEREGRDSSGLVVGASESFRKQELQLFYERVSSQKFHDALARHNHGVPVPAFKFRMTLCRQTVGGARRVEVSYSPGLHTAGPTRELSSALSDALEREYKRIDPSWYWPP